jgi:Helix-turn-helix domain
MRYPASEKLEIIRLVEQSHLPARRTQEKLGVSRATFYRWCDLYQTGGPRPWKTDLPGRTASGTEFPTMCLVRSCNWPWMSHIPEADWSLYDHEAFAATRRGMAISHQKCR